MNIKRLTYVTMFIALTVVGGMIKIPAIISSVAFDSAPAIIGSILFGTSFGMIIAAIGHLVSALIGGFPMGPLHIMIAFEMAIVLYLFKKSYKVNKALGYVIFVLANTATLIPFIWIMGVGFVIAMLPSIALASICNVIVGGILAKALESRWKSERCSHN